MKTVNKAITTTSDARRLACLELAEGIGSVFPTIFWRNTTALLSLASATPSILFHLLIIRISSWLHLPANGRKRFLNRSRAGSVPSVTVTFPSREIGLSLDFDSVLAHLMESGTMLLLLGASNRRPRFSNRFRACSASSATTTSSFQKFGFNFKLFSKIWIQRQHPILLKNKHGRSPAVSTFWTRNRRIADVSQCTRV